jgi:hypothetical protein
VAPPETINANEDMVAPMVGSGGDFGGSLELSGRFCVGAFGRNLALLAVKMFSHFIYFNINFINVVLLMGCAKTML